MLPAPMLQWLARLVTTGLLFVPLSLSLPGWLDSGQLPEVPPALQQEDPARDYRILTDRLSQYGLSADQIRFLWNRLGGSLSEKLDRGELTGEQLAYLTIPYAREGLLARYEALSASHPELTREEAVLQVNMGLDRPFYQDAETVSDPSALDVLVNKYHVLSADFVPELVPLTGLGSGSLDPRAAEAFRAMAQAAQADGITLRSVSAYRSYQTQHHLYNSYSSQYGQHNADTYSARAGSSEHQTGLALDINAATRYANFEDTADYAWLQAHCADYGFILRYPEEKQSITGYRFEPWHYRYIGEEAAHICMEEGLAYEEYLARLPADGCPTLQLTLNGSPLDLGELPLLLEGRVYVPAVPLAQALGWTAADSQLGPLLTRQGAQLLVSPLFRRAESQADFGLLPALSLDGGLYLPLDELCAALGAGLEETGAYSFSLTAPQ